MKYVINERTFLISSAGGHKYELFKVLSNFNFTDKYFLTFKSGTSKKDADIFLIHPKRKIINTIINFFQSLYFLIKFRPKIIFSTGADVALFTLLLGKVILNSKIIYIESFCTNSYSITGKIAYFFSDLFIVHHLEQLRYYPKARLTNGGIL